MTGGIPEINQFPVVAPWEWGVKLLCHWIKRPNWDRSWYPLKQSPRGMLVAVAPGAFPISQPEWLRPVLKVLRIIPANKLVQRERTPTWPPAAASTRAPSCRMPPKATRYKEPPTLSWGMGDLGALCLTLHSKNAHVLQQYVQEDFSVMFRPA
jgi:hypothetical protein